MTNIVPYAKPSITALEIKYAADAAENGWGEKCYEYIDKFEELFKRHLGVEFTISTSSCTGALHMGLAALGIGPGDEVILADTNWIATASPVVQLGAAPVFVDILRDSWCIDPEKAEVAITGRTRAIIATHLYGNLCQMDRLLAIGEKYGIAIIEDAAEAIGSVYHGKPAGSMGSFGVFSFHGSKTVTTGEGGMFVTKDRALYEHVLSLSNHGRSRAQTKQFWPDIVGFKYKMSNIQAAIGCAQLERLEELVQRKKSIFHHYRDAFDSYPEITVNPEPKGMESGFWMTNVVFSVKSGIDRQKLQKEFKQEGIDARVFFWPLSSLPMFAEERKNLNSWEVPQHSINLPSFHDISTEQLGRVTGVIHRLMATS